MKNKLFLLALIGLFGQIVSLIFLFTSESQDAIINSLWLFLVSGFLSGGALVFENFREKREKTF